jgi:hypothetical protein
MNLSQSETDLDFKRAFFSDQAQLVIRANDCLRTLFRSPEDRSEGLRAH